MIPPLQTPRARSTAAPPRSSTNGKSPATDENQAEAQDQAALQRQQAAFNFQLQERAELLREFNELRTLQMEQLKHDDEIVKKWIEMI